MRAWVPGSEEGGFGEPRETADPVGKAPDTARALPCLQPSERPLPAGPGQMHASGSDCFALRAWPERPWVLAENWVNLTPTPTLPSG